MSPQERKDYIFNRSKYIAEYMSIPVKKSFLTRIKRKVKSIYERCIA